MKTPSPAQDDFKVSLLTLSFPGKIEKVYQDEYFQKSLKHVRIALLLGVFFYGIFGILDAWIFPEAKEKLWIIRYAVLCPFIIAVFLFSYSPHFKRYMQLCIASVVLLGGLGIITMILVAPYPGNYLYYAGLILVFIYGYTFFKLRFVWATFTGLMIVIAYEIAATWLGKTPIAVLVNNNFFFLSGNIIGMFACYSIELYSRRDFMHARLLEAEREKVDASNRELEKRVKERTAQLIEANKDLKQEIVERRRAEDALKESEKKYRTLFEDSRDAVFISTREGKLVEANQSFLDLFNFSREEILGLNVRETYVNPNDRARFQFDIEKKGSVRDYELKLRKKDETEMDCLLTATVRRDDDGNILGYQGVIRDITDKKKLEAQLRQAQKMEAIGTLAGGIAHDFNNILSAIIGYTQIALDDVAKGTLLQSNLQEVLKAGRRASDVVKQILTFSRKAERERKPLQISLIVKEALKLLRASLPATIEIHQKIGPDPGTVLADPTQIHQVLMNLCTNAAQAMDENGGILEVNLTNVELDPYFASRHPDIKPGPYLRLTVSDTGHGMDPSTIERIFDPFFTTKNHGKGTGMGLAVVHGIVKSHGGTITVYSTPGQGSTFNIYLPVIDREVEPETGIERPIPTGNEHILFIDDEQAIAGMNKQILERLGYEVVARTSSLEALELFKAQPDNFDLVITDMTMPNMTGEELARELMSIRPDIPIILCSGYSEKITEAKAKVTGVRAFVGKPILKREIAETIRRVLDQEG